MLKNILVATDASASANRAIALAADMAARYEATLHILYVVRQMQLPEHLRRMAEVEKLEGPRDDVFKFVAGKILADAQQHARESGARTVKTLIGEGDPATVILDEATRQHAELIVLGTRGLGKVKGQLLGSVSRKVSNLSKTNCLVVH